MQRVAALPIPTRVLAGRMTYLHHNRLNRVAAGGLPDPPPRIARTHIAVESYNKQKVIEEESITTGDIWNMDKTAF